MPLMPFFLYSLPFGKANMFLCDIPTRFLEESPYSTHKYSTVRTVYLFTSFYWKVCLRGVSAHRQRNVEVYSESGAAVLWRVC